MEIFEKKRKFQKRKKNLDKIENFKKTFRKNGTFKKRENFEYIFPRRILPKNKESITEHDLKMILSAGRSLELQVLFSIRESNSDPMDFDDLQNSDAEFPIIARGNSNRVRGDERFVNYGCYCTPSQS